MNTETCKRCAKRVPERPEFLRALAAARKQPTVNAQYKSWWAFIDAVCTCPERGFPTDLSRLLTRSHIYRHQEKNNAPNISR